MAWESWEPVIRLSAFVGVFVLMAVAEAVWPIRRRAQGRGWRWPNNLAIVGLGTLLARLVLPMAPVAFALSWDGGGLLGWLALPGWLEVGLAVVALDGIIYLQHRLFHRVPVLWRLHRMHHADIDFDVTTALRFHPLEILLSLGIKFAAIAALGAPALSVVIFEVVLNGMAMFNHANVRLPAWLDAGLRTLFVTPDMHRVHHSVIPRETHSNFGFNLSLWDRWFGTYVAHPEGGQVGMVIGLPSFRDDGEVRLDRMLTQPFRDDATPALDVGTPRSL